MEGCWGANRIAMVSRNQQPSGVPCELYYISFDWTLILIPQNDIETAAANVLDLFSAIDLSKILHKIKLHLLAHLRADIICFGPLVGLATEGFECFNAIFRLCSILSNHLAPSRDIAKQLADQEAMKHRLTGGWWHTSTGDWVQPGAAVHDFLHTHPMLQRLVGWTDPKPPTPGLSFGSLGPKILLISFQVRQNYNRCPANFVHDLLFHGQQQSLQPL
jgi:hypothetical protein